MLANSEHHPVTIIVATMTSIAAAAAAVAVAVTAATEKAITGGVNEAEEC